MSRPDVSADERPLKVALLGCGVVGSAVARQLTAQADDLEARIGRRLEIAGIAVRRLGVEREGIDPALLTTDAEALVARDDVDLVVEVVGGIEPARSLILRAMEHGASVVTANKALLADDGATLFAAAEDADVDLYFEAAVAGAIPIIRPLRESLAGDEITAVMGIVNGTTNFILDKMHTEGSSFDDVLAEAQALGYAEADPTADVEGFDAAAKAAILAGIAFHSRVNAEDVHREGITEVTRADIAAAEKMGCVVKLLAICELNEGPEGQSVSARVHPAMIPTSHPLASVGGAYNAVFVESRNAGQLMFYGPGAGGDPTASAVMGDLVTIARNRVAGAAGPGESTYAARPVAPVADALTRYFIALDVHDQPGVLANVARCFAERGVSVRTLRQEIGPRPDSGARLVVVTHEARDGDLSATVEALRALPDVSEVVSVMRVEGEE
ncbi:homoserine dehydrogenase [Mariniluteicoccus endophyticus]